MESYMWNSRHKLIYKTERHSHLKNDLVAGVEGR